MYSFFGEAPRIIRFTELSLTQFSLVTTPSTSTAFDPNDCKYSALKLIIALDAAGDII